MLSRLQIKAVTAILATRTLRQAAKKCGAGERTLRRWLHDRPEFRLAVRDAGREILRITVARLQGATGEAVGVLRRNLRGRPGLAVKAAGLLLNHAGKLSQFMDLEERVKALEEGKGKHEQFSFTASQTRTANGQPA